MRKTLAFAAATTLVLSGPAFAQVVQQDSSRDVIGTILSTIFGTRGASNASLDSQWSAGQTPLGNQQYQFSSRVDAETRSGNLTQQTALRLKADYADLVATERSYVADGRITSQERADLSSRYTALTQALSDRGYNDGPSSTAVDVAAGRAEFNARIDAAVAARRITRTQATRLRTDYNSLIQVESSYLRDGRITAAERNDLDTRLDALDARLGDAGYSSAYSPKTRLDALVRALPTSGLPRLARAQILIELEDLTHLADAYARLSATTEDQRYLNQRLTDVEAKVRAR